MELRNLFGATNQRSDFVSSKLSIYKFVREKISLKDLNRKFNEEI